MEPDTKSNKSNKSKKSSVSENNIDTNMETNALTLNESPNMQTVVQELITINEINKIPLNEIKLKRKIGEGGQAKVYRGVYGENNVAVKVLGEVDWKCLAHEIVIVANLSHPNIPKFYGIINEQGILALVFQFIEGKTLDNFNISEFNDQHKLIIISTLGSVLEYIHSKKFIHRDLKPENIIIDNNFNVYLIDFGIAKVCTNFSFTKTRAKGTIYYLAPECLDYDENSSPGDQIISVISTKVDVWAYGCIVSWLYSGHTPWCNQYSNNSSIIQKVLMKKKPFPIPSNITNPVIIKVIKVATKVKLDERAKMAQIMEILNEDNLQF